MVRGGSCRRWFCIERFTVDNLVTLHYKVTMKAINRIVAIAELLLVLPGMLFMSALFVRNIQPEPYEPAHTARRVVGWYSSHPPLGLHVFLLALPFAAFIIGCSLVVRRWRTDVDLRLIALHALAAVRPQWP